MGEKKWDTWVYAYWGITPKRGGLGQADLPQAVRDRDQLPADERVPDSDDDQEVQRAVPLRGDRAAAEEPVGVVASRRSCGTPRQMYRQYDWERLRVKRMLLWLEQVAADLYRFGSHNNNRKEYTTIGYDLTQLKIS